MLSDFHGWKDNVNLIDRREAVSLNFQQQFHVSINFIFISFIFPFT